MSLPNLVNMAASVYGWGLKTDNGPLQKQLLGTTMVLHTDNDCYQRIGHELYRPDMMLCASAYLGSITTSHGPNSVNISIVTMILTFALQFSLCN